MSSWSDFLRKSILGKTDVNDFASSGKRVRVPFKFTSDLNLSEYSPSGFELNAATSPTAAGANVLGFGGITQQGPGNSATTGISIRTLSSDARSNKMGIVSMAINPQSIRWSQGKRFVKRDTMDGSTFMHFLNSRMQDNDIPRIEFQGHTGNISLKGSGLPTGSAVFNDTHGAEKLLKFHQLWNLTRQAKLFKDSSTGKWVENKHYIIYESQMLPFPVQLVGFYDTVLSFDESAEKPNQVSYSFSFIVQDAHPGIDDIASALGDSLITSFTR